MIPDIADMIGKRYEDFGRGPDAYDCVGVVLEVLRRAGKNPVDWVLADKTAAHREWKDVSGLPAMSVVQIPRTNGAPVAEHVAIYLGGGMVMHANEQGVEVASLMNLPTPISVVEYCGE